MKGLKWDISKVLLQKKQLEIDIKEEKRLKVDTRKRKNDEKLI